MEERRVAEKIEGTIIDKQHDVIDRVSKNVEQVESGSTGMMSI